jgi:hypothetical protein
LKMKEKKSNETIIDYKIFRWQGARKKNPIITLICQRFGPCHSKKV